MKLPKAASHKMTDKIENGDTSLANCPEPVILAIKVFAKNSK